MKTQMIMMMVWIFLIGSVMLLADPMTTAFTYQGRLLEDGQPATGTYDLQCKLFDDKTNGNQIGDTLTFQDGSSPDGYFTIALDFGVEVFNGEGRYLEMAFRPYDSTEPNDFVALADRVELTPTPYALQTRGIYVDPNQLVGIGTTTPGQKLHVADEGATAMILQNTTDGVIGEFQVDDEYVSVKSVYDDPLRFCVNDSTKMTIIDYGYVGIGTTSPDEELVIGEPLGLDWSIPAITVGNTSGGAFTCGNSTNHLMIDHGSIFNRARIRSSSDIGGWSQGDIEFICGSIGISTSTPAGKLQVVGDEVRIGDAGTVNDATSDGDLYVEDTLEVDGAITKAYTAGTNNSAIPIAYAFINSDGSVASGTPNVSCSWNATNSNYEISIAGESYYYLDYVTVVTVTDSNPPRIATTGSVGGDKLTVNINNVLTGTELQAPFQFITYKP